MVTYNSYMKNYLLARYSKKRALILIDLGGKCVVCGTTQDLEIDHINKDLKTFDLSKRLSGAPEKVIQEELKNCQLLCKSCHNQKSLKDSNRQEIKAKNIHGTLSSYRYCKCILCKKAKSDWMKNYYKRKTRLNLMARLPSILREKNFMEITLTKSNVKATIVLNANAVFSPEKSFPDSLLSGNCDSLILERSGTRILPSEIGINGFDQYFSQNIEATNLPTQTFKDLYNALEG